MEYSLPDLSSFLEQFTNEAFAPGIILMVIAAAIWDLVWKGIGMWKSARHGQTAWFVAILILNTLGILPIIYILFFQKKQQIV